MSITLPATVATTRDANNLECIVVRSALAQAIVYRHGAHLTHWQPAGHQPVLWMSAQSRFEPDQPIRGGVPICFPWFGAKADNSQAPTHGLIRLENWELLAAREQVGTIHLSLGLQSDPKMRSAWPHDFTVRYDLAIGAQLTMNLTIKNSGATPFRYEEALHTYFSVGDVRKACVRGVEGQTYHDKLDGLKLKSYGSTPVTVTGETELHFINTTAACILEDPLLRRRITVSKTGSQTTVIWNPWIAKAQRMADFGDDEWPGMLCIETANAYENALTLAPGAAHTLTTTLSVENL